MAALKQIIIALVLITGAAVLWARFYPGAPDILARWGIDWASAAVAPRQDAASGGGGRTGADAGGGRRGQQGFVVTRAVATATINDRLVAIGTGRDNASVALKPYSAGRLTEIVAKAGDKVAKGDVIARLDSEAETIAVDRARIALDDATERLKRVNALRTSNTATAVQVTDAQIVEKNAQLSLRDAELALERRAVLAPIAGIVGIIPVEEGNYVTTDTEIAMLTDRSSILVEFWVPERYATSVKVGQEVSATSIARPDTVLEGEVSAVDARLDEQSRTLLARARIANDDDTLRAGMSFQVSVRFPGDTYPSVDPLAIQWGTDGAFVWAVRDDTARRTPVRIIQRNADSVLVDGALAAGDAVVTQGVHLAREGSKLDVGSREPAPQAEPTANTPAPVAAGTPG